MIFVLWREQMIMRRPYSRTATRRHQLAEGPRNAQVSAEQVKEQAKIAAPDQNGCNPCRPRSATPWHKTRPTVQLDLCRPAHVSHLVEESAKILCLTTALGGIVEHHKINEPTRGSAIACCWRLSVRARRGPVTARHSIEALEEPGKVRSRICAGDVACNRPRHQPPRMCCDRAEH